MPLVLRIDRYCVFFWANEGEPLEPIHVHVAEGNPVPHATKIWLLASGHCRLRSNGSRIPEPALRNIMRVLEAYHEEIVEKWVACFRSMDDESKQVDSVGEICERFHIERTSAYKRKDRALSRLTLLLYGK